LLSLSSLRAAAWLFLASFRIQRCQDHVDIREAMLYKSSKVGIQIHVRFESIEDRVHGLVNEDRLREIFMDCGEIEDAIIQRHSQVLF
jgi:hypothetical protein